MSTFRLSRFFSQPEILRGIDPENLLSILADHAEVLAALGLPLPDVAASGLDYGALMQLLMEPDKLPGKLREAFYFVHEMATPEGMDFLVEAAANARPPVEIIGNPGPTPGDVACQVWLKAPELMERTHAERFLQNVRSFKSFGASAWPVPRHHDPMAVAALMKKDLDDFFEKKKRGRNTKVFPYTREDGVWFLVRHGDPFKREGAIDDKGESYGAYYWPEKFDVVVLNTIDGELRINARNKGELKEYRRVFGRYLYGDEGFFTVEGKYTLEPLRSVGEDSIAPIEGMDHVHLTEMHFRWDDKTDERVIHKAPDDLFSVHARTRRTFPEEPAIVKACFRIKFTDSPAPRTVAITLPNEAQYMRDADSVIVEKWLKIRGFIVTKGKGRGQYEPAVEKILVSA